MDIVLFTATSLWSIVEIYPLFSTVLVESFVVDNTAGEHCIRTQSGSL